MQGRYGRNFIKQLADDHRDKLPPSVLASDAPIFFICLFSGEIFPGLSFSTTKEKEGQE